MYTHIYAQALSPSFLLSLSHFLSLSLSFSLFLSHTHTHIHKHMYKLTHVLHQCSHLFHVHVYTGLLYKRINTQLPSRFASPLNAKHTRQNLSCFICMQRDFCMCHITHSQNKTPSHFTLTRQKSLISHIAQGKCLALIKTPSCVIFHTTRLFHFKHFTGHDSFISHIFLKTKLLHISPGKTPSYHTRQDSFISHKANTPSYHTRQNLLTFQVARLLHFKHFTTRDSCNSRDKIP